MAPKSAPYKAYSQAFQTVAKTQQIVMLYDGVIRYIKQAKEAIKDKRIEDRYKLLVKASEVILGLQACIDFEKGERIAQVLYDYYASIDSRILGIHRSNSEETCDQLIAELKEMRDAWEMIDRTGGEADSSDSSTASTTIPATDKASNADNGGVTFSA